jgi:hypothetical protein
MSQRDCLPAVADLRRPHAIIITPAMSDGACHRRDALRCVCRNQTGDAAHKINESK